MSRLYFDREQVYCLTVFPNFYWNKSKQIKFAIANQKKKKKMQKHLESKGYFLTKKSYAWSASLNRLANFTEPKPIVYLHLR